MNHKAALWIGRIVGYGSAAFVGIGLLGIVFLLLSFVLAPILGRII